jgi:hypothetical protein
MTRARSFLLGAGAALVALLACAALAVWTVRFRPDANPARAGSTVLSAEASAAQDEADGQRIDVQLHETPRIKPGTVIGNGPPEGWSHLILHGVPRVAEGDVDRVPAVLARLVSLFHLTILATTEQAPHTKPPRYRLASVAIGLGTDVDGRETIVSSDTQESLGANLGLVERSALAGNEACLDEALQVARTPTILVFDATAIMRLDGENRHVIHRHAVLVAPRDGRLMTVVWALLPDSAGEYHLVDEKMRLLADALEEDRKLYVDARQFRFGLATQEAFALADLPPGKDLTVAPDLQQAAESRMRKPVDAARLENLLREAIASADEREQ